MQWFGRLLMTKNLGNKFYALFAVVMLLAATATVSSAAEPDWKREWERTLAAAKKRDRLTIYIYRYERLLQDFKKEYPGINVVSVTGRGTELTARLMAERRAGKYIADVYSGGTNGNYNTLYKGKVLDPVKPALILPEVVDLSKWYGKEHRYARPRGTIHFRVSRLIQAARSWLSTRTSSIRKSSSPTGTLRIPNGKVRSCRSIREIRGWARRCSSSTITRRSAPSS